jgi:hypothetical protein
MKKGKVFDGLGLVNETNPLLIKGRLKLVKGLKRAIDKGLIRKFPKMLGRVKFRGVRRQGDSLEPVGKGQMFTHVPRSLIKHPPKVGRVRGSSSLGEIVKDNLKSISIALGQDGANRVSCLRSDKSEEVKPRIGSLDLDHRTLSFRSPAALYGL